MTTLYFFSFHLKVNNLQQKDFFYQYYDENKVITFTYIVNILYVCVLN